MTESWLRRTTVAPPYARLRRWLCAVALVGCAIGLAPSRGVAAGEADAYRVYVTNEMSGDLTVIDGATHRVTATIALGKRPRGVQPSHDGKLLYVALSGSPVAGPGVDESSLPPADKKADGIGVVDLAAGRVVRIIRGVSDPEQLAVSPDGAKLYVASEDTGTAVVFDESSGKKIAELKVGGEPEGVAMSPDGRFVYMTSEEDHSVAVIDTVQDRVVARIPVGQRPRAIAFDSTGARAYITGENDASVTVVDAQGHRPLRTVRIPGELVRPMGVAVSHDDESVYAATGRGGFVVRIDTRTFKVGPATRVGERPWGLAISPDGERIYTANGPSNDVSVLDARTMKVIATVKAGDRPWGVAAVAVRK